MIKGIREPNISREIAFNNLLIGQTANESVFSFLLNDTGANFVARQNLVPWTYIGTNHGVNYEMGTVPDTGRVAGGDGRTIWGTDIVIHLHDDADGGGGGQGEPNNRLRMLIQLYGYAANGRPIEEKIWIANEDKNRNFVGDSYYRTRFAYSLQYTRLLEFHGSPTVDDYLEIGYDHRNHYNVNHRTNAREKDVRFGIPWRCRYLEDIACVKIDSTPLGEGLDGLAFPKNVRGVHAIDLVQAGALYDPEDGAVILNDATKLNRPTAYNAEGETWELEDDPTPGRHILLFTVDPRNPPAVQRQDTPVFYTNEMDFWSAPMYP